MFGASISISAPSWFVIEWITLLLKSKVCAPLVVIPSLNSPIPGVKDTIILSSGFLRIASKLINCSFSKSPTLPPIPKSGAEPASTLKPFLWVMILLKRGNSSEILIVWSTSSRELLKTISKSTPTKPFIWSILLSMAEIITLIFVSAAKSERSLISTFWENTPLVSSIKKIGSIKNLFVGSGFSLVLYERLIQSVFSNTISSSFSIFAIFNNL